MSPLDKTTEGPLDNTEEFVVPPGHYFMMGDNRDNSDDSREAWVCAGGKSGRQGAVPLLLHRRLGADLGSVEVALRHPLFAHPYLGEMTS
jgi:hypothetical protein